MEKTFQDKTNLYNKLEEALSKKDVIVLTKSDKSKLERLEKKHKVSFDSLYKEFEKGVKVEKEHMKNIKETKKIALVHLAEDPKYYTKLKKAKLEETITKELNEESLPSKLKSDVEIEYHKNLNPQFWLNNHLKINIRKNLLNLSKFYFKSLDLDSKVKIKDIIFTGSLANYNYTDFSDIDIHIVIDYKDVSNDIDFVKDYFSQKRAAWETSNDVKINDYPIEIYVQDESQLADKGMGAMYSLLNNKWIKKPKYKLPEVDRHLITQKVNKYLDILNKISMMDDSIKKLNSYNKVFEKIRDDRRKATQTEGEFSVNNLVFKILRNKKVFDIIKDNKKEIVNNVFSINSN
jgi:predicted nucleotidyltransferase